MRPAGLGIVLGAINVLVIAFGMAAMERNAHPAIIMLVMMFGMVPGVVAGALLGWLAGRMKTASVAMRRLALMLPAVLVVAALADEFDLQRFIVVSCIPTLVAVLILERHTRFVAPPIVPPAQIHRV